MLPLPLAAKPVAPPVAVAVKVRPVSMLGNVSATLAPVMLPGPALVTTIVYVIGAPGTAVVWPSLLVICKSAEEDEDVSVSVSVALLLAGLVSVTPAGAETVAVFDRVPVAVELSVACTV